MSPIVLSGGRVRLRPFREDEVDRVMAAHLGWTRGDGAHEIDAADREKVRERVERSGTWAEGPAGLILAIESEGRLVGEMQARGGRAQLLPPDVFELGIDLYDQEDRRRGIGTAAVVATTRYLFEEEGALRVQISTDVDNAGMRGACERAGFRFEGVLRSLFRTEDGPRDYAMYAMTRDDHQELEVLWT